MSSAHSHYPAKKLSIDSTADGKSSGHSKKFWILVSGGILTVIAIGLGVGLGVGLTQGGGGGGGDDGDSGSGSGDTNTPTTDLPPTNPNATVGTFWRPATADTWQIVLGYALNDTSPDVSVYDIDLFTNEASMIQQLHDQNRRVICYFSAGSYEDFRPDSSSFVSSDYAKPLDGWPGEYWINTKSSNVRDIMTKRLALAAEKGCDGVDPDNVDGYDNDTGLDLTPADAVDYLTFLAIGAHALNMSIGLKNSGQIVNATLDMMQWEINEQCVQYDECALFQPFIEAGKPVFGIEYPDSAPTVSESSKEAACAKNDPSTQGFSMVLKEMLLGNWMETC
ncbi:endo alpha-1,4 polygalactosaminidase precursor [Phlyctema vagabunda]|uniref:alpha-galactosidase n=1 Tax=Phlyctema vagabunda TaxID=108571 RepID=A0ABR4PMZ1_9HELO